jgi:hypothetical protein
VNKHLAVLAILALVLTAGFSQTQSTPSFKPKDGYVPNSETAVKIAEAVLMPVFGEATIASERPFKATLKGDVWTVEGTLHCNSPGGGCKGGTATVRISKSSGAILLMGHYK